jgi:gentisate 1,2-dioxygenase
MWTDGLDSPMVRYLENLHMDAYTGERQPVREGPAERHVHYRWNDALAELRRRAQGEADPFDDVIMEYLDPSTGRSVVPALGCYLQMLRPGVRARAHRETSSAVYHVVTGAGRTVVDGVTFEWGEGDFFAVPPRAVHEHANPGAEPAILFSFQDVPLLRALGFYRMEPA